MAPSWADLVPKWPPKWPQKWSKKCSNTNPKNDPQKSEFRATFGPPKWSPKRGPVNPGPEGTGWEARIEKTTENITFQGLSPASQMGDPRPVFGQFREYIFGVRFGGSLRRFGGLPGFILGSLGGCFGFRFLTCSDTRGALAGVASRPFPFFFGCLLMDS